MEKFRGFLTAHRAVAFRVAALAVLLTVGGVAMATEPTPLLPDTGIDFEEMVSEVVGKIGVVVGLVVAAFFAFVVVRRLMSWGKRIG